MEDHRAEKESATQSQEEQTLEIKQSLPIA
jgi:hypothetical protein